VTSAPGPSISIRELRKRGVFDGRRIAHFKWKTRSLRDELAVQVTHDSYAEQFILRILIDQAITLQVISSSLQRNGLARNLFFVCPVTGKRVSELFFSKDQFSSRHALRSRYPSQDQPRRPPRLGATVPGDGQRKAPALGGPSSGLDLWSMARGLERGQKKDSSHRGDLAASFDLATRRIAARDNSALFRPFDRSTPKLTLEDHPRLDSRVLAREGLLRAGQRSVAILHWPRGGLVGRLDLYIDMRNPQVGLIFLEGATESGLLRQVIQLSWPRPTGRQRVQFLCPVTFAECEVLAYRDGRFASVSVQRLIHQSQQRRPSGT